MVSSEESLRASFFVTGFLLTCQGFLFLLAPHLATKFLLLAPLETTQALQYARATGLGLAIIGYYYMIAGKYTLIDFYRASLSGRVFGLPVIIALIYFYSLEVSFLIFGIQDLLSMVWSYLSLKAYDREHNKKVKQ